MRTRARRHRSPRTRRTARSVAGVAALSALLAATPTLLEAPATAGPKDGAAAPIVIGHRGASGYRPEHTLAAYALAIELGADYIEPDLVSTRDGVLVARHENEISTTTDVSQRPEFTARRATKTVDGEALSGWFTEDFTLAELRTLRAVERIPEVRQENTLYDGRFEVPTFDEVLALRARLSKELHREIGVYPETKHPTYFRAQGKPLEGLLVAALQRAGLNRANAPVYVQSFELNNLAALNASGGLRTRTVFLTSASGTPFGDTRSYASLTSPTGLALVASVGVDGIGPDKNQVIPRAADGTLGVPSPLVADAHAAGLTVHPYTFRAENTFLPTDYRVGTDPAAFGRAIDEQLAFLRAGVDGLFTDQADIGVVARDAFEDERGARGEPGEQGERDDSGERKAA